MRHMKDQIKEVTAGKAHHVSRGGRWKPGAGTYAALRPEAFLEDTIVTTVQVGTTNLVWLMTKQA